MFSSVYFHSCFAAEKGRSLLLNLLCQLPTKDISQALPCAQQFSVDTLFSKFQSFVFLFFMFAANQQSANDQRNGSQKSETRKDAEKEEQTREIY